MNLSGCSGKKMADLSRVMGFLYQENLSLIYSTSKDKTDAILNRVPPQNYLRVV